MKQRDYEIRNIAYYFMQKKDVAAKWPKKAAKWSSLAFQFIAFMPGQDSYRTVDGDFLWDGLERMNRIVDDVAKVNADYAEALRLAAEEVKTALCISHAKSAEEMTELLIREGFPVCEYNFRELKPEEAIDEKMTSKMKKGRKFFCLLDQTQGVEKPKIYNDRGKTEYFWKDEENRYVPWLWK